MDTPTQTLAARPKGPSGPALTAWGHFELRARIGEGSYGEVYRAWDPQLQREVALKILKLRGNSEDEAYETTLREARALARVRHPNVVQVYGVDRHEGRLGFWSDYIRGSTLQALVTAHGPFNAREAVLIGIDLCRAVSAVHGAGLLHRDIKPSNAMREAGGRILLMDFGSSHESGSGKYSGTLLYMSPELLRGEEAAPASDIYALGVLLYYLVSASYPVQADTAEALLEAHRAGARRSLYDARPDLPDDFIAVVQKAIEPDPALRFSNAGQMMQALSATLGGDPAEREARTGRRAPWLVAGVLAAVVVGAAIYIARPARTPAAGSEFLRGQQLLLRLDKPANLEAAVTAFQNAIRTDPRNALAYAGLARAYYSQYRATRDSILLQRATESCARAAALNPQLSMVHWMTGKLQAAAGNTEAALQEVLRATELDPRSPDAWAALGEVYDAMGRKNDAEEAIRKAVELSPNDWRWYMQLGVHYDRVGESAAAARQFQEAVRITPDNSSAWSNLGTMHMKQENFPEARKAFEACIRIAPLYAAYSNLGTILLVENQFGDAVPMFEKALNLNSSNYKTWGNLAAALQWSGQAERARQAYQKAVELAEKQRRENPADPALLASLGGYLADLGQRAESLALLRQALALDGDNPDVLVKVGTGFENLGMRGDALRLILKAMDRGFSLKYLNRSPDLEKLRKDPTFQARTPGAGRL